MSGVTALPTGHGTPAGRDTRFNVRFDSTIM
jgi:hypothetical protein